MCVVVNWFRVFFLLLILLGVCLAVFVRPVLFASKSDTSFSVAPSNLRNHVQLFTEQFAPFRVWDAPEGNAPLVRYIEEHFKEKGGRVTLQSYSVYNTTQVNIIGAFGDEGPLLVVGAHYDVHAGTPGADDNASGVAGLLEIATLLGRFPLPGVRIELVAFATEEPPHFGSDRMGSVEYVRSLQSVGQEPELAIVLEMIGYFRDEPNSQNYPAPGMNMLYPHTGNFVSVIGNLAWNSPTYFVKHQMLRASSLPVYSLNAPEFVEGIALSDHSSFWRAGFPAVMITDTAMFRNPHYHQTTDTVAALDYARMAEVVSGVYEVLRASAGR